MKTTHAYSQLDLSWKKASMFFLDSSTRKTVKSLSFLIRIFKILIHARKLSLTPRIQDIVQDLKQVESLQLIIFGEDLVTFPSCEVRCCQLDCRKDQF